MKLLLVDDHGLFRSGLRLLLASMRPDLQILEAESCSDALNLLHQHSDTKICLIDLSLRGENGMDFITVVKETCPAVVTVVVSATENASAIYAALDAGARGYVPKSASPEVMVSALKKVLEGGVYVPRSIIEQRQTVEEAAPDFADFKLNRETPSLDLTSRQRQVLHCLLNGMPNKLICRDLNITDNTLKGHLKEIYRVLAVSSRTQAVLEANKRGFHSSEQGPLQ